jgi:catechol 2,3-dioxygenase-like lactoylglutathione lyase family enzyme
MPVQRLDHFTVVTDRLAETVRFYEMFGLRVGPRPPFPMPGAWLYCGDHAVLHLLETPQMPVLRRGALDHMAWRATDLLATTQLLEGKSIRYRLVRTPAPFQRWQLFFEDPNGVEVELDFDAAEAPPENWRSKRH